jgi:hypothetical protein
MQESGGGENDVAKEASGRQEHFNPKDITKRFSPEVETPLLSSRRPLSAFVAV